MIKEISVDEFMGAIKKLPSNERREHWLGWLAEYDEPGFYNRLAGQNRSAKYAYNHMASAGMLLWLIEAAGVKKGLVELAKSNCDRIDNVHQKCGAIRKQVPWAVLERSLWMPS